MARAINILSARRVAALKLPGRHSDGGGLYLRITDRGARAWVFMANVAGKRTEIGLGPESSVTLAAARRIATSMREAVALNQNPRSVLAEPQLVAEPAAPAPAPLFGDWADEIVVALLPGFKNEKHRYQWEATLKTHAASLRNIRVDAVTTDDVLAVLRPMWTTTNDTARRLRGRIKRILDAARAKGHISAPYENPARWEGHLEHFLAARLKAEKKHFAAMPYTDLPPFMVRLRGLKSASARALELTILCATRSSETLRATLKEFDLAAATWTIPAARMKMAVEHVVPLSTRAVALVRRAARGRTDPDSYLFPGAKAGKPLSAMAMVMLLRGIDANGYTVHGMRSAFRDWAGDTTDHPREIAELSLAHAIGDSVEQAYRRSSSLAKRRVLLADWSGYLDGAPAARPTSAPTHYLAFVASADGLTFSLPDMPGLTINSGTDDYAEALAIAQRELRDHLEALAADSEPLPPSRGLMDLRGDPSLCESWSEALTTTMLPTGDVALA